MYSKYPQQLCRAAVILRYSPVSINAHPKVGGLLTSWLGNQSLIYKRFPVYQSQLLCTKAQKDSCEIVYSGEFQKKVFRVKVLSFTSSLLGLFAQPVIYEKADSLPLLLGASTFIGFFTFVTPILLHLVCRSYVLRLYHNEEKDMYTADMVTFFCRVKQVHFKPGEAAIPDVAGMFTTMEVKGIPMLLDLKALGPYHAKRILGYDKPLDIRHESIAEEMKNVDSKKSI